MIRYFAFLSTPLLSMLILILIGSGEARQVYQGLLVEKEQAEATRLQGLIGDFLDSGLQVSFVADILNYLDRAARTAAGADNQNIATIAGFSADKNLIVYTRDGERPNTDQAEPVYLRLFPAAVPEFRPGVKNICDYQQVYQDTRHWWVVTPLYRGEQGIRKNHVGCIAQSIGFQEIDREVNNKIEHLYSAFVILGGILAIVLWLTFVKNRTGSRETGRVFQITGAIAFLAMAILVLMTLVRIYEDGILSKVKQYGGALAHQLSSISDLNGLAPDELEDVQHIMTLFHEGTSEIDGLQLVTRGKVLLSVPAQQRFDPQQQNLDFSVYENSDDVEVRVWPRANLVRDKVLRNIRNFSALFVSCCFAGFIWFSLVSSVSVLASRNKTSSTPDPGDSEARLADCKVNLLQCVWFLAVFIEGLNASFMPQFLTDVMRDSQLSENFSAILFSTFFAAFVLSLVPAGKLVTRFGSRRAIITGLLATGFAALIIALRPQFEWVLGARLLAGAGHGLLFIAVQAYILSVVGASKRSSGSAKIVFAQNSGILSGAAMGALIVLYIDTDGIFLTAAAIAAVNACLVLLFVPGLRQAAPPSGPIAAKPGLSKSLALMFSDGKFMGASLLVGTYSKVIYNGAVFFAIPIILLSLGYDKPTIGQLLMLFAFSVMLSNHFAAPVSRRFGTDYTLIAGMLGSTLGCILLGLVAWSDGAMIGSVMLVAGIVMVGLANGFIAAPIVTSILDTRYARTAGVSNTMALYRFIERTGHVLGPILLGWLLLQFGPQQYQLQAFFLLAGLTLGFMTVFWLISNRHLHHAGPKNRI